MEEMILPPPKTIMEVYKMLPEGTLAEVIEGSIYMSPAPNDRHNGIVVPLLARMFFLTENKNLGRIYTAPHSVFLDENSNAVQPDIFFVARENLSIIREDAVHGAPDLIIEVLSPGNKTHDTIRKKNLYEHFGVREYWIIDPVTRISNGYSLENGVYLEFYSAKGNINSKLLDAVFEF